MFFKYLFATCIVIIIIVIIVYLIFKVYTKEALENYKHGVSYHMLKYPHLYNELLFKEEAFPPQVNQNDYWDKVYKGYERMKRNKIIISGLVKDASKNISLNLLRMEKLGLYFSDYLLLLFENDSIDSTREIIFQMSQKNARIKLIDCPEHSKCLLKKTALEQGMFANSRFEKMAEFRNRLLNEIRAKYRDYHYVLFIDWDLSGPISFDGIANCFGYYGWDSISANGLSNALLDKSGENLVYYDSLAYVDHNSQPTKMDYWSLLNYTRNVWKNVSFQRGQSLVQVDSGFCAAALYRMPVILDENVNYSGDTCEHVAYHRSMKENGYNQIFINPSFILLFSIILPSANTKNIFQNLLVF